MHEDLEISSDTAEKVRQVIMVHLDILKDVIDNHADILNDELSLVVVATYNGLRNILVRLHEVQEIIQFRQDIHGKMGIEKTIKVKVEDDEEEEEPEEPWDDYDEDEYPHNQD